MKAKQEYYSLKEIAVIVGVNWQTVRNEVKRGNLKSVIFGRRHRISREELEKYISSK